MYDYGTQKQDIFTEEGQILFLRIRDKVKRLLNTAGAARMFEIIQGETGDSWQMLACVDRLVDLGEIREITNSKVAGQYRVFIED